MGPARLILRALAKCFDGFQNGSATVATDGARLSVKLHADSALAPDQFAAMETNDFVSRLLPAQHGGLKQAIYISEHVLPA